MKVLFIGTDIKLFEPKSSVHERFLGFSSLGEEAHVVVARPSSQRGVYNLSSNIFIHPTSSKSRLSSLIKSFFVGYKLLNNDKNSNWVISVQDPFEQGWVGFFLSKFFNKPLHVQVHTDILSPFFLKHSTLNKLRVFLSKPIIKSAKRIRVDAVRMKDSIVKKYKILEDKIDVLQIYIDVDKIMNVNTEKPIEGDYVLYVGRFESEKNVESIIRGFARASSKLPNLKLVLLGSGSLLPLYKALAQDLGVLDKITVVPWSNNVGSYMKHSKALILASWFEGFALVLVEALLNDCPVITTDVGAIGGIIPKEYAHIFPQNDDSVLSQKIEYVVLNENKEKEKVKEGKSVVLSKIPRDIHSYAKIFKDSLEKNKV